ncbi:MAG: TonB-dependent receptor [Pseudomonadota bacterium]
MSKSYLMIGAAAVAMSAYGTPALAQDSGEEEAESRQDVITVTARKTEETLQETPVAVSVVTADVIDNLSLTDLSDISKLTPGLSFDNEFGRDSNRPVIRGQANILGASGVSYFIDGVRISGAITDYDLNDIERIEIVKGPQSALYGRNTYSGAINIITRTPGDDFSARASLDLGEHGQQDLSIGFGGAINDYFAFGFNTRLYNYDGEFDNVFDGQPVGSETTQSVSGVLYFTPNDDWDIRLRGYYSDSDDGQPALFATTADENNCFFDNGALYGGQGRYFCGTIQPRPVNSDYRVQVGPRAGTEIENSQISLSIDGDLNENWSVTSITGFNTREVNTQTDGDYSPTSFQATNFVPGGFPFNIVSFVPFQAFYGYPTSIADFTFASASTEEELSQELRLNYEADRFRALIGAYYLDGEDESRDARTLPQGAQDFADANFAAELASQQVICGFNPTCLGIFPLGSSTIAVPNGMSTFDIENRAVFGLVSYDVTDTVSVTLEGRYAEEDIERNAPGDPTQSASFDNFAPRATIDWQVTPDNLLYAVYAEGQKPGGFNSNQAQLAGLGTFEEEEVASIEIGSKNTFFGGQLTANIAGFFNEVEGYQLTQNVRVNDTNTTSATVNAGDAEILGLEAEFRLTPDSFEGLTATLNYAWTDTEFTAGRDQNEGVLLDTVDDGLVNGSVGCEILADPTDPTSECLQNAFGSIVGREIPRTAEHQIFFDLDYRGATGYTDWDFFAGANVSYESSKFSQVHNQAETGDATLVGARVGISNGQHTLRLWGRNLLDEDSSPLVLRYADGGDSFKRNFVGTLRRGSQIGVTLSTEF